VWTRNQVNRAHAFCATFKQLRLVQLDYDPQQENSAVNNRGTRDEMSSKKKARVELIEEGEEDAYGSDDPSCRPDASAFEREEEDGATQGSPKGYKRSRLNSVGEGVPVPVKTEKIKTPFEPLVRDTDGCATTLPFVLNMIHFFQLCSGLNSSRSTTQFSYLRPCRILSRSSS
jgi:hypothetical protein